MQRPLPSEYKHYFQKYIDLIPEGDFISVVSKTTDEAVAFFSQLPEEKHNYRYAPGKWSIKDVLMHIADTDRVMAYRALVAARGDGAAVMGLMDEDLYAANVDTTHRHMDSIAGEFLAVRSSAWFLFASLTEEQALRTCNVAGHMTTARAWGYIMIGHLLHHMNVVQERYL
jgi:uncharacterized damage-inducible protein DinB